MKSDPSPGDDAFDARGLSPNEAARRLARDGPNELPAPRRDPRWLRLARHLAEPMSLLLVTAALVAGVGLRERLDALAILAIVVLNAVIGTLEEGKAERALDALGDLEPRRTTVIRGGTRSTIDSREVVCGDLVVLTAGDRVPADLRLFETSVLEIDESLLTGESLPVAKSSETSGRSAVGEEGSGRALSGTLVIRGSALGVADATGAASAIGNIATRLEDRHRSTPLQRELGAMTARLGMISILIAAGVFGLTLVRTGVGEASLERSFLAAVALAVAAVPEGLATVVAVALALGVRRMAARGAIVRRLPAVETLGSATVILIDKTGTLTENRMRLDTVAVDGRAPTELGELPSEIREPIAEAIVLCNDATIDPPTGDPLEVALLEAVDPIRVRRLREHVRRIAAVPFDAERRRMTTVHVEMDGTGPILHVKGAPEAVLERCTGALRAGGPTRWSEPARATVREEAERMASRGVRTLALARRELDRTPRDPEIEEHDLTFLGLVGLRDPVRPQASGAVGEARAAGIEVVMVTGDHPGTAAAIADQVGLLGEGGLVLTGDALDGGIPDRPLEAAVYARVDPEGKLALVEALQSGGHVVAVTGDGVNDAPALRRADIGVAMGRSGSEVAREASDMVITDDDLATIVAAVREGRGIYGNIRKVVDYLIGGNLSEISVVVATLVLFPDIGIPLLPLQLLWINLVTDGLPALALGLDPAEPGLMQHAPRPASQRLLALSDLPLLIWRALLIAGAALGSLAVARFGYREPWVHARGVMFSTLVVAQLLYAFMVRGEAGGRERPRLRDLASNPWLQLGIGAGLILQLTVVAFPPAREVFGTATLTAREWVLIAAAGVAPIIAMVATARPRPRPPVDT